MGGAATHPTGASRPPGLPGLLIGEVSVKGVLKAKGAFVAILQSSDTKTYLAHAGDRVMDGAVKSEARRQIEYLFAPLKLDNYRLTDEGFVPVVTR